MVFDVAIVGGGVIGAAIFNKLVRINKNVVLLEKCDDVALGASRANSGLVHAGFDCEEGTLKAKLNLAGNKLFPLLCKELSVPYYECGAVVVGNDLEKLETLKQRGIKNGVSGLKILNKTELKNLVPNILETIEYGLLAKTAGIVSPWNFTIALCEEGVINGGVVKFGFEVEKASRDEENWKISSKNETVFAKYVVNSAGASFNQVSLAFGAETKPLTYKSGEYFVLDTSVKNFTNITVFPLPTEKGKGVLVTPTADGNILVGPSSTLVESPTTETTASGLEYVKTECQKILKNVPLDKCIRVFAGVRTSAGTDFVIEKSSLAPNMILLAGINSPGLSASPAIANMVAELLNMNGNEKQMKKRTQIKLISEMEESELDALIKKDPNFGKIVCRCEKVSQGEVIAAINSPLRPQSVDAIKRRVRAGMGRCQGGFCMSKVMDILASETKKSLQSVCKENVGSEIVPEKID